MRFFLSLLACLFLALIVGHIIPPITGAGARVLLMPLVFFYSALALPMPGMLGTAFVAGLMWDAMHTQFTGASFDKSSPELTLGWSVILFAVLGSILGGFRPMFLRGRWHLHCLLSGVSVAVLVLMEYVMISVRRVPLSMPFDHTVVWRILGAGIAAAAIAPLLFFLLNRMARFTGWEFKPEDAEERMTLR